MYLLAAVVLSVIGSQCTARKLAKYYCYVYRCVANTKSPLEQVSLKFLSCSGCIEGEIQ